MTFMAWIAASVVFLLQLAALATQQQPARGSIEGVVERAGGGEPIAGAEIRVMRVAMPGEEGRVGPRMAVVFTGSDPVAPVPAITDREGHFLLTDLVLNCINNRYQVNLGKEVCNAQAAANV